MPIITSLRDENNEPIALCWGRWPLDVIWEAIDEELDTIAVPSEVCPYVFTKEHTFTDPADGEVLVLKPGYTYDQHR